MYIITATHPTNGETAIKHALTAQDANNKYDEPPVLPRVRHYNQPGLENILART